MNRESVSTALQELRCLAFPKPPSDPDLGDWIMDLLEADSYYAGTATAVVSGAPFTRPPRDGLDELAEWLSELRVASPEDQAILDDCHTYFAALQRLHEALQS
jgi:hypothetical protein